MQLLFITLAILLILYGFRLIIVAGQAALTGRFLVRQGRRTYWHPAPSRLTALKSAFRDMLMGILLIVLGWVIIF